MFTRPGLDVFSRPLAGLRIPLRSRAEVFSGAAVLGQILEGTGETGGSGGLGGRISESLASGRAHHLSEVISQLNPADREALRRRWGRSLEELESLSHERDARVFYSGLLQIGQRLEDNDALELAGVVYSALAHPPSLPLSPVPPSISSRAQVRLNAMTGVGASGERLAFLARRVSTEATRPDMLIAMGAAGAAFRLTRLAATARFAGTIESGFGLRAAANISGFFAETVAFTGVGKLAGAALGYRQDWSPEALFHEWAGGATMLLGLKVVGAGVGHLSQRWAATETVFGRFTQAVAPQLGMFGGILAGNRLSEFAGFHPHRDGDTWFVDGLSTLLQFNVAGRLQHAALGPGFARFERRIDFHTERLARETTGRPGILDSLAALAAPELVTPEGIRLPSIENPKSEIENLAVFSVRQGEGDGPGSPGSRRGGGRELSRPELQRLFAEVLERGKKDEVEGFKNLLMEVYSEALGRGAGEILERYHQSRDIEEWRRLIRIVVGLIEPRPESMERLQRHPEMLRRAEDWFRRPHFRSTQEVTLEIGHGVKNLHALGRQFFELQKLMVEFPTLDRFQNFVRLMSSRAERPGGKPFEAVGVREAEGGMAFVGNWGRAGFIVRFSREGFIRPPIQVLPGFAEGGIQARALELRQALPPTSAGAADSRRIGAPRAAPLQPERGENPTLWATRLLERSRGGDDAAQLQVAQALESVLQDPKTRAFGIETVERFRSLVPADTLEGKSLLVRDYADLPGLVQPLRILSLPTTFLPENWSLFFARRVVAEIERNGGRVGRAMEIGSGTGWLSVYLAKRQMVGEMIGVDTTASAPVVSRINAYLNGVEGVEFFQSDLLSAVPEERKADLIVACIPQIPATDALGERQFADQYPERNNVMRPYGLGLIFDALRQSLPRMSENGRVLFNLAGRPGLEVLKEMYRRAGFHPAIRHHETIPQDPTTSIQPLANLEGRYGVHFEFLDAHSDRVLAAQEALGVLGIRHRQYLIEGIPYAHSFHRAAAEVFAENSRWGYTPDAGSEHPPLQLELLAFLKREWGAEVLPETLHLGPEQSRVLESMLRIVLPPGGRVRWVGDFPELIASLGGRLEGFEQDSVPADLETLRGSLRRDKSSPIGSSAFVLSLDRAAWSRPDQHRVLADVLMAAAARKTPLFFVEPHPLRVPADGVHPLMRVLQAVPEARPYVTILQSLDQRFHLPDFPLTAALIGNPTLARGLVRAGELDYSRVSTPLQSVYVSFLNQGAYPAMAIPRGLARFAPGEAVELSSSLLEILNQRPPFESLPTARHPDPIDMSFGESEWMPPTDLREVLKAAVGNPDSEASYAAAQAAVASYLRASRGVDYEPSQILLGTGVQPLLGAAVRALREIHGGRQPRVVVPHPSYGLFFPTVQAAGGRLVEVPAFAPNRFTLDATELEQKLAFGTRVPQALLLNSPTNPAGQYYSQAQLAALARVLQRGNSYLFWDDVFGMLNFNSKQRPAAAAGWATAQEKMGDHLLAFGGISKEFAAGGLRFGFAVSTDAPLLEAMRRQDPRIPDPLALGAAQALLPEWRDLVERHRSYLGYRKHVLEDFFRQKGMGFHEAQGGLALYVDLHSLTNRRMMIAGRWPGVRVTMENFHELLMEHAGIRIHSPAWARVPGHFRFVYSIERIEDAVERLRKFFQGLR